MPMHFGTDPKNVFVCFKLIEDSKAPQSIIFAIYKSTTGEHTYNIGILFARYLLHLMIGIIWMYVVFLAKQILYRGFALMTSLSGRPLSLVAFHTNLIFDSKVDSTQFFSQQAH